MNMPVERQEGGLPSISTSALALDPKSIESMMLLAETMVSGKVTVPDHLRNKGDCLAIIMQAMQWGMNPYAVAQKTHLVSGKLGYEAQLVNAVVSASGAIQGRFHYEYRGDGENLECRVGATLRGEQSITWGEWLALKNVTTRNSPLWKTNQRQQLGYLQLKNWSRLYAPGPILGVYTTDELELTDQPARITPDPQRDILPELPAEQFDKNLPTYRNFIKTGQKAPDTIINTLSTKYTLTEAQKSALRAIQVEQPTADDAQQGEPQA